MTTLQDILQRPQRIGDNLSSRQMFLVLDGMIERAIEPLADTSDSFLEMSAEIVASRVIHRRKIDQEIVVAAFSAFFHDRRASCHAMIKANVDRGFMFAYLHRVSDIGKRIIAAHVHVVKNKPSKIRHKFLQDMSDGSRILGRSKKLVPALQTSAFWYTRALDFRDQIVEKYIRLIYKSAVREHKKSAKRLEIPDLFGTGYLTAVRAVEKFNSNSGVLTSYMALWLRSVSFNSGVQSIGVSFNTKSKDPDDVGWSVPLDVVTNAIDDSAAIPQIDDGSTLMKRLSVIAFDPDVRAALAVSGVTPTREPTSTE